MCVAAVLISGKVAGYIILLMQNLLFGIIVFFFLLLKIYVVDIFFSNIGLDVCV